MKEPLQKEYSLANNRLKELRYSHGLSQMEIAAELGVDSKTYRDYENGKRRVPSDIIDILTNRYKCSENYIYNKPEKAPFTVDIRDLISYDGIDIHFTIPVSYWDYLLKKQKVYTTYKGEKTRNSIIAETEKTYANNSNYSYSVKIDWNNFMSFFNPDEGVKIPHLSSKDLTFPNEIPAEYVNEATQFFQELIQSSEEN